MSILCIVSLIIKKFNTFFVNKNINNFDETLLLELDRFLNFEDDTILNFYNNDIADKKIDENKVAKIFKDFKL